MRTAGMFGKDPYVPMSGYPGLAPQLHGVGICYVPPHPLLLLALPEPRAGIQQDPVGSSGVQRSGKCLSPKTELVWGLHCVGGMDLLCRNV